jgi:hypothetical protein
MEDEDRLLAFLQAIADRTGTEPVKIEEADAVLDLARIVAHTHERRFAPLTTYLAGFVLGSAPDWETRSERLRALTDIVREIELEQGG